VLKAHPAANVRALIVWEPVLATDWGTPGKGLTSTIPDRRATHFWDRERKLSQLLGGREKVETVARRQRIGFRMRDVIWDAALVYPPHSRWGAPADLLVATVVSFRDELDAAVANAR
jgi:hypothetical protein